MYDSGPAMVDSDTTATIPTRRPPDAVLPPGGHLAAVEFGIHPPGALERLPDRVLPLFELIAVQDGVLPMAEEAQRFRVVAPGWLLLHPGRRHYGTAKLGADLWFYWVCFSFASEHDDLPLAPAVSQTGFVIRPDRVRSLFKDALADEESGVLTSQAATAFVVLILNELSFSRGDPLPNAARDLAERAATYIAANLADPDLTTSTIARALGYSPDHLERVFRAAYRNTLVQHIHRSRVVRARALLRSVDWPVERVALATGFRDHRYFVRVFRRYADVSPGTFRSLYPPRCD